MSGKQRTLLTFSGIIVILVILAVLFPLTLPPIEAGPMAVAHVGEFPISNSMIVAWVVVILLILFTYASTRNMQLVPSGVQNLVEAVIETLNGLVTDVAGERGKRFFPFVATIFLFVLLNNWLGLLPGVGSIGVWEEHVVKGHTEKILVPLFRSASADLNTTVALAIVSVVTTQILGIMALGFFGYAGKFINIGRLGQFVLGLIGLRPRKGLGKLLFWGIIDFVVGIIELFSEVMKIVTFSFRLFGNIFAGEVILIVMPFLFAQILPIPFYALEMFVGFIQAFVFAMLTLVFMTMATAHHGGEAHAEH